MSILNTRISKVTVYPEKALIIREGTVKISSGKSILEIPSLPLKLDPSSIRVKGSSVTGSIIEGIDIQKIYHKEATEPDQKLLDKLEELHDKLEELEQEINFLENRLGNSKELEMNFAQDFSRYYSRGEISLEKFNELREQIAKEYLAIIKKKKELERKKKEIEKETEILNKKLVDRKLPTQPTDYTVYIQINNPDGKKDDEFALELSYIATDAQWWPSYDFRSDLLKGEIIVEYFGMVKQTTGEEWENIELTLSTASPTRITTIPELSPWYVDAYRPPPHPPRMAKLAVKKEMDYLAARLPAPAGAIMEEPLEEEREEAKIIEAVLEDVGEAQTYKIPKNESITSENRPHQVLIAQITNPLKDDFISFPTIASEVIHRGTMVNESEYIFLPGQVRLFDSNEFIGTTHIEQIAPAEKFRFALGTTGKIKVKRKLSSQEVSKKGMIAKTKQIHKEVTIEITNNRTTDSTLLVKDTLPLSRHEDIKVKILNLTPVPKEQTDMNICTWKLVLKPNEKLTIVQSYDIEHPVDLSLQGA